MSPGLSFTKTLSMVCKMRIELADIGLLACLLTIIPPEAPYNTDCGKTISLFLGW